MEQLNEKTSRDALYYSFEEKQEKIAYEILKSLDSLELTEAKRILKFCYVTLEGNAIIKI